MEFYSPDAKWSTRQLIGENTGTQKAGVAGPNYSLGLLNLSPVFPPPCGAAGSSVALPEFAGPEGLSLIS